MYFLLFFPVYIELQPRQSLVPGLVPVSICHPLPFNFLRIRTEHPAKDANPERASRAEGSSFPSNPLRIRTSKAPLPQPLYNPHLRNLLRCAGNTGLITLLESAVTKNAPATLLESALPRKGGGVLLRKPSHDVSCPEFFSRFAPVRKQHTGIHHREAQ